MSDPGACDEAIYRNGVSYGVFDLSKAEAEEACKKLTEETGNKHDWHYFGGRVHIKFMPLDRAAKQGVDHG